MTTEIELLPLPEGESSSFGNYEVHDNETMIEYARANVAHATAAKDAEIERLRTEIESLRAEVAEWKRVASAQAELHGESEARAERLAEALRRYGVHDETCVAMDIPFCTCGLDAALEQETTNG